MATVKEIEQAIFSLAPREYACEWDNVGLLCGRENKEVRTVLVALDPFLDVCREAEERHVDLVVTHHPLIFRAVKTVTDRDPVGRCILFLIQHDIAAINAHTNLDQSVGGVNDRLAEVLELTNVTVPVPGGYDAQGRAWGLLRVGETAPCAAADFAAFVKEKLHCNGLRYIDGGRPVHRIAVGGGACGDEIETAYQLGCDTLVTADVKYNQFQTALDLEMNLVDAGHFETENPVCDVLAAYLQEKFPDIQIILSAQHGDPVQFL